MTENLQADCVQSRQACFIQCFLKETLNKAHLSMEINFRAAYQLPLDIPRKIWYDTEKQERF